MAAARVLCAAEGEASPRRVAGERIVLSTWRVSDILVCDVTSAGDAAVGWCSRMGRSGSGSASWWKVGIEPTRGH